MKIAGAVLSLLAFLKGELLRAEGEPPPAEKPAEVHALRGKVLLAPTPAPTAKSEKPAGKDKRLKKNDS